MKVDAIGVSHDTCLPTPTVNIWDRGSCEEHDEQARARIVARMTRFRVYVPGRSNTVESSAIKLSTVVDHVRHLRCNAISVRNTYRSYDSLLVMIPVIEILALVIE
jgi:hypothetical protein